MLCRGEWLNDHVEEVPFYLWSFSNVYLEELTAIGSQQKSEIHAPACCSTHAFGRHLAHCRCLHAQDAQGISS